MFPEKKLQNPQITGQQSLKCFLKKNPQNAQIAGQKSLKRSLEKIRQNAQITGQKSMKCFLKTSCRLSDCYFESSKSFLEKKSFFGVPLLAVLETEAP